MTVFTLSAACFLPISTNIHSVFPTREYTSSAFQSSVWVHGSLLPSVILSLHTFSLRQQETGIRKEIWQHLPVCFIRQCNTCASLSLQNKPILELICLMQPLLHQIPWLFSIACIQVI